MNVHFLKSRTIADKSPGANESPGASCRIASLAARSSVEYERVERVLFRRGVDVSDEEYPAVLQSMAAAGMEVEND